jgi:hypothetical protein
MLDQFIGLAAATVPAASHPGVIWLYVAFIAWSWFSSLWTLASSTATPTS